MSLVKVQGNASGTGIFTIASPNGNTDRTLTLPDNTGTILTTATPGVPVNGPAFQAQKSSTQSVSGSTTTKIQMNSEIFDTANCYDPSTNYRFTPNVAGYYWISGSLRCNSMSGEFASLVYKNGSVYKQGVTFTSGTIGISEANIIMYLNGSTDYVELYVYTASTVTIDNSPNGTLFSGFLARSAT